MGRSRHPPSTPVSGRSQFRSTIISRKRGRAAWAHDDSAIYFWAVPDAIGHSGFRRDKQAAYLYAFEPASNRSAPLSSQRVYDTRDLTPHPTQDQLLFYGKIGRKIGVWLYDINTNSYRLITREEHVHFYTWSADGKGVLVSFCEEALFCDDPITNRISVEGLFR